MNNRPNPFQRISDMIPESEREAVTMAIARTYRNKPTQSEMETLFRVWNEYVSPDEKQDITCRGCRIYVVGKLREVVKLWHDE